MTDVERCVCCDLPVVSCGNRPRRPTAAADPEPPPYRPTVVAVYHGKCWHCGHVIEAWVDDIRRVEDVWIRVECCGDLYPSAPPPWED